MKLKLAVLLSFIVFALAGCNTADNKSNTSNAPANNANNTAATAPATTAQKTEEVVAASSEATAKTGGTKEGCKCSAVGMACNHKEGEKGCCGGKDGECSSMKEGKSACCAGGKDGACCSVAKTTAAVDHKNMDMSGDKSGTDKKSETAPAPPTKKS